jgi:hypothetical protein
MNPLRQLDYRWRERDCYGAHVLSTTDIEPFELIEGDEVLTHGTLAYFKKDRHSRALQAI